MRGSRRLILSAVVLRANLLVCFGLLFLTAQLSAEELPKDALEKMASEKFEVREEGHKKLEKWVDENPDTSPEFLHAAWVASVGPEVQTRCYELMKKSVLFRKFGPGPGFIGITMQSRVMPALNPDELAVEAVLITQVMPNTPGKRAGLLAGDVIVAIDKIDFKDLANDQQKRVGAVLKLSDYIKSKHPEDIVTLHIIRADKKIKKDVQLMLRPDFIDREERWRNTETRAEKQERYFNTWLEKMGGEKAKANIE